MKFIEPRGCRLEHPAPVAQKEDTSMSRKKNTPPTPVLASTIEWNTASGPIPAVRLTGLTHTIYVGPDDLPRLEDAVRVARARLDALQAEQAQQAQEVAA